MKRYLLSIFIFLLLTRVSAAQGVPLFDVTWNELGTDENTSMPLGNGDISVNAWTADFKLHAPYNTTVEAHVEKGKITRFHVTPKSREKDIIITNKHTDQ